MPKPRLKESKYQIIRVLVDYRQAIGMSLKQVAQRMGNADTKSVSNLETTHQDIRISTLFRYMNAIGIGMDLKTVAIIEIDDCTDANGRSWNPERTRMQPVIGDQLGAFLSEVHAISDIHEKAGKE